MGCGRVRCRGHTGTILDGISSIFFFKDASTTSVKLRWEQHSHARCPTFFFYWQEIEWWVRSYCRVRISLIRTFGFCFMTNLIIKFSSWNVCYNQIVKWLKSIFKLKRAPSAWHHAPFSVSLKNSKGQTGVEETLWSRVAMVTHGGRDHGLWVTQTAFKHDTWLQHDIWMASTLRTVIKRWEQVTLTHQKICKWQHKLVTILCASETVEYTDGQPPLCITENPHFLTVITLSL